MKSNSEKRAIDEEWEKRRLCPDGNCIGVIGPDGCCKECGRKVGKGDGAPVSSEPHEESRGESEDGGQDAAAGGWDDDPAVAADDEWENRTLCSDESCIGVIGPNGTCRECGTPSGGKQEA